MSGTSSVASRATYSGGEFQWPTPWEGIGYDWYEGAREKYAPYASVADLEAARSDLVQTLATHPRTYWCRGAAERELFVKFGIVVHTARRLMQTLPGSAVPAPNVWCAQAAAVGWSICKAAVFVIIPADRAVTFEEIAKAVEPGVDTTSAYCAVMALSETDRSIVCLRNEPNEAPQFVRVRPGGRSADYTNTYTPRPIAATQPAA